jgi:hypothetical protein
VFVSRFWFELRLRSGNENSGNIIVKHKAFKFYRLDKLTCVRLLEIRQLIVRANYRLLHFLQGMTTFWSSLTINRFFFFDEPMESETPFIISVSSCGDEAFFTSGIPLDDDDVSEARGVVEPGTNDSSNGAGWAVISSHFSRILSEYSAPFHLKAATAPTKTALPSKKLATADPDFESADTAATIVVVAVSIISVSKGLPK